MIGLFNDCFPPIMDGVSLTTQNYAYWLHKKTGNVCVVTPKSPDARDAEEYPVYRYSSIPIPMRKPYRLGFPRIDWPFHERISRLSFELVHAHCPFSSGALAMQIAREQHVPVVATFHSKYRADFERAIPSRLLVDYLIRKVIRFYEAADEVWIPQAAVEETLREYGYKGRVEVVDNGNDFAGVPSLESMRREARRELGLCSGEFMFLFVGQHIWEKNLGFLLDALALLPDVPFRMYFVGSGYANDELKQKVAGLGLSSKVTFVGSIVEREVLKRYYVATDLFLFPSLYDNAPLVVREAAALGTPSILIKDSTASEIISDSVNGFLSFNSTDAYAGRIREILQVPAVIRQVGEEASRTIARSWEDVTEEVYDRYSRLIKRKENR
ncbi:glycosyltransferase [Bacteroides fragilis]|uniref:glycosyltransferase n=1 Tax=Bacteroides fragilis TaxID=817 RepID=UPI001879B956|nr:glycosyltransferase [Bacteroides fragilis]MBE7399625.1 glycosyltransferase [Bacteroides fragilis]